MNMTLVADGRWLNLCQHVTTLVANKGDYQSLRTKWTWWCLQQTAGDSTPWSIFGEKWQERNDIVSYLSVCRSLTGFAFAWTSQLRMGWDFLFLSPSSPFSSPFFSVCVCVGVGGCGCVCVCVWLMAVFVRSRGDPVRFQLIPLTDWVVRGDMRDDSVEILLHSVLQEAPVSSSGMGLDVHSLMYIQHFLCWPRRRPPSKVPWRMVLGNTGGV